VAYLNLLLLKIKIIMKIKVFDHTGKELDPLELRLAWLGTEPNHHLLTQAIRVYLANSHQHTSKVKSRGEVRGSRRKIWRQKGTGNARHGDRYAPIFVGGGVAHGPKGLKPKNLVLPKKMKRKALASALLIKFKDDSFSLVKGFTKLKPKTSALANLLAKVANHPKTKVLIVADDHHPNLYFGARNLQRVTVKRANLINAYDLIFFDKIVASPESLEIIKSRLKFKQS